MDKIMRVYLDSNILLSTIVGRASERRSSQSIIERLSTHYDVVIPQIVIAEVFSKILIDNNIFLKLRDISNVILNIINPSTCIPNASKEVYKLALEIIENDDRIDICDATIVAQAILDSEADILLTFDRKILRSDYINYTLIPKYDNRLEIKEQLR
jgi:predicted nucleic acid-binding protein